MIVWRVPDTISERPGAWLAELADTDTGVSALVEIEWSGAPADRTYGHLLVRVVDDQGRAHHISVEWVGGIGPVSGFARAAQIRRVAELLAWEGWEDSP
jgi:hypothetical protein